MGMIQSMHSLLALLGLLLLVSWPIEALRGGYDLETSATTGGPEGRSLLQGCNDFVRRRGTQLTLCGQPFYFVGFNAYWLGDKSMSETGDRIERFMRQAKDAGMNVGRIWGFSHGKPYAPGKYKEDDFRAFDHVIHAAGQVGIKLQISLGNFWQAYRGPEDWLWWAGAGGEGKTIKDFYYNQRAHDLYMDHVKTFLYRTNTYNGKKYKDDPAIMAWDIMNEPRCPGCDAGTLKAHHDFLARVGGLIRSIDSNHLITAGTEGYFFPDDWSNNTGLNQYNPGGGTQCEGEDWVHTSYMEEVDIAVTHVYERQVEFLPPSTDCSKNWKCIMNWAKQYTQLHTHLARTKIGKPVVIQETGVTLSLWGMEERKMWFKMLLDELITSWKSGSPLMGVMFWNVALCEVPFPAKYDIYLDGCNRGWGRKLAGSDVGPVAQYLSPYQILGIEREANGTYTPSQDVVVSISDHPMDLMRAAGRSLQQDNLGYFRQEGARMACAHNSYKNWQGKFDPWHAVDLDSYKNQISGKSDMQIIRDAAWVINGGKGK